MFATLTVNDVYKEGSESSVNLIFKNRKFAVQLESLAGSLEAWGVFNGRMDYIALDNAKIVNGEIVEVRESEHIIRTLTISFSQTPVVKTEGHFHTLVGRRVRNSEV